MITEFYERGNTVENGRGWNKCPKFVYNIAKEKEIDAPSFWHLVADGQLLIYVNDAIRYIWLSQNKCWPVAWEYVPLCRDSRNYFGCFSVPFLEGRILYIQAACNYLTRKANFKYLLDINPKRYDGGGMKKN